MSINRVGTALVAAVGCLVASDLSPAAAAQPAGSLGRPIQLKPSSKAMKVEMVRMASAGAAGNAAPVRPAKKLAVRPTPRRR